MGTLLYEAKELSLWCCLYGRYPALVWHTLAVKARLYSPPVVYVCDPNFDEVSMDPNEQRSGDVDLPMKFKGLDIALKKSDIHLFWTYRAPKELNIPMWSGGWILLPQQK